MLSFGVVTILLLAAKRPSLVAGLFCPSLPPLPFTYVSKNITARKREKHICGSVSSSTFLWHVTRWSAASKYRTEMMAVRAQPVNLLITSLCIAFFILANYYFFFHKSSLSFGSSRSGLEAAGRTSLDSIWDYRLNLTSLFIKLTQKERDLFNKLKSIRVKHLAIATFWIYKVFFLKLYLYFFLPVRLVTTGASNERYICTNSQSFEIVLLAF